MHAIHCALYMTQIHVRIDILKMESVHVGMSTYSHSSMFTYIRTYTYAQTNTYIDIHTYTYICVYNINENLILRGHVSSLFRIDLSLTSKGP